MLRTQNRLWITFGMIGMGVASWANQAQAECNFIVKAAIVVKQKNTPSLGKATTDFIPFSGFEGGCYQTFQNGSVYVTNKLGAWIIGGAIRDHWNNLGGPGFLGVPTTDETATPDGVGRYNHFSSGSIYWHPCMGAHEVHGLIRDKWAAQGWEKGPLGYPKSDETKTSDGVGRYTEFQGGRIYWHPTYGTFTVSGSILNQWADLGFEKSNWGYPIEDQKCGSGAAAPCSQKFKGGTFSQDWNRVDLRGEIARRGISIRNQGGRPTCSVFAMTFLFEYAYSGYCGNHYNSLSEEFLNHTANLATGRSDDGDFFSSVLAGYNKYGVVTESQMPYQTTYDYNAIQLSSSLIQAGAYHIQPFAKMKATWVREYAPTEGLTNAEMSQILSFVRNGTPVAIGRSHSLVIVGYEKGNQYPGGGRFIIRNSYGLNAGGTVQGYQYEDFQNVQKTVYDAIAITR